MAINLFLLCLQRNMVGHILGEFAPQELTEAMVGNKKDKGRK